MAVLLYTLWAFYYTLCGCSVIHFVGNVGDCVLTLVGEMLAVERLLASGRAHAVLWKFNFLPGEIYFSAWRVEFCPLGVGGSHAIYIMCVRGREVVLMRGRCVGVMMEWGRNVVMEGREMREFGAKFGRMGGFYQFVGAEAGGKALTLHCGEWASRCVLPVFMSGKVPRRTMAKRCHSAEPN